MGGGFLIIGIGGIFGFYGLRFIRDKSANYRFTKGLTLLGLALVCWGTFPQAQRFGSGTQIFAQLIVGLLFFGVGGAVVGFLIDWYRRHNNSLNPASGPASLQGGELDSKAQTSSGPSLKLNGIHQPKTGISAADLVRLEQITSLRDRGTLSPSQFEMERDIILGAAEAINQDADAPLAISPPPPPPSLPPESSLTAEASVQGTNGANVIFIAIIMLLLLIALIAFNSAKQSSPEDVPAMVSDTVSEEPSNFSDPVNDEPVVDKCAKDVDKERWQSAFASCSKEAEQGILSAQHHLGRLYSLGNGVSMDRAEAVRWYRTAADRGYADSQVSLGYLYSIGEGVVQDDAEAVRWYRKGAEQGDPRGQAFLGLAYNEGEGVKKDLNEAVRLYRKSADQGYVMGQGLLGLSYEIGEGVEKDLNEAIRWYRMAADQGDEASQEKLRALGQ